MKTLLLITALFCALHGYSQNYAIGHTTINFQDPERGNRQIETEIYYPATNAGDDTPAINDEFPVIVFGHGFVMAWSAYENLWNEFVPRGYIMVFPRTEGNILSTDHQQFGWDLEFLVTAMQQQGSDQNSLLFNAVAPETALMGHSMGGGAAFLAADSLCNNGNTNLKTLVGLAPAESSSNGVSSIASATEVTVPSFILSGVQDGVTPAVDHHIPMYNNLASDCKTILHITGGAHCYFANSNFNCDFGEGTSSAGISISRQDQHDITFDFLNLWFDYTLKADCNDFSVFNDSLNSTPRATYDQVCSGPITFESTETVAICSGDSYLFPDGTIGTTSIIHTSSLSSVGGCDSIIETTLTVQPSYQLAESATICNGDTYTFPDGSTSSISTVQSSVLTSITGCDSIIETTLTVQPSYQLTESATICNGDTYTFPDGSTSSISTVQSSVLTSITGCDSIIETTLTVQPSYQLTESATICNGDTYTFPDGSTSSISTVQSSVLTSITGCDSIIETTLTVQPSYQLTESATICNGDTYTFPDGSTSSISTVQSSVLTSITGCDSIIETTLTVQPSYQLTESATICNGDTYTFPDGSTSSTSTVQTSVLTSITGCDSIIETTLTVQPSYQLTESATICNGDTYTFPDGSTSSTSTVQTSVLTSITGCDSIIETTLTVQPSYQLAENVTICNGDTYTFPDGSTSSTSTVQSSVLTSITGCDSTIETTLDVVSSFSTTENITMCQGTTYVFPDGTTGSSSMTYTSTFTSSSGCDSVIETNLTVIPTHQVTETATICDGDTYTFPDGTIGSSETVHTSNLISMSGCDSIVETTLNVTSLNLGVSNSNGVLTADESGASYQWIDCDNSSAIFGETSQSFTPSASGDYAVEITLDGCTEISDCYELQVSGLKTLENGPGIELFPNPSNGHITINSELEGVFILFDVTGKMIKEIRLEKGTKSILLDVASGIYSWKFESTDEHLYFGKVVVEKP